MIARNSPAPLPTDPALTLPSGAAQATAKRRNAMHKSLGGVLLATSVLVTASASSTYAQRASLTEQDHASIAQLPIAFSERSLAADWDGVAALYHEDAIQMPPDAPAIEGRDNIRDTLTQMFGPEDGFELKDLSLDVLEVAEAQDFIYVRAAYHFTFGSTADGDDREFEQYGPYVNILRRDPSGTWLIYRQIYNRDHPPPGGDPGQ
jgi:ketosteroid isomerase-like protein